MSRWGLFYAYDYKNCQHSVYQGYKAADVTFFNTSGNMIAKNIVGDTAKQMTGIGGVGVYTKLNVVHIDIRPTKADWNWEGTK